MNTSHDEWSETLNSQAFATGDSSVMNKLPVILRTLGGTAIAVAMYSFLAKGWLSGNDVFHYLLMLGHTSGLAIIGLASGHWLKESKGARLLLSLSLASVPVNFAILGAFLYSQTSGVNLGMYPYYVAWTAPSLQTALLVTTGAMLVLIPITLIGFTVLARGMSRKLSLLFLVSNAVLLLPIRDPQWIGLLVLGLTICTVLLSRRAAREHSAARTREGVTALCLQLLPMVVMSGRNLWLYSTDLFLLTTLSVTVYFFLRQMSLYLEKASGPRKVLDMLSLIPAMAAGLWLSAYINMSNFIPSELAFPFGGMISAALIYDISLRSYNATGIYRHISVMSLTLCMIINLMLFCSLLAAIACLVAGIFMLVFGYDRQQISVIIGGVILLFAGVAERFYEIVHHFDLGGWAVLAALGILSIVIASTIESQGEIVRVHITGLKDKFQHWSR